MSDGVGELLQARRREGGSVMNERLVDIRITVTGKVPWWVVKSLFDKANDMCPEDGLLAFTVDGDVPQPVQLARAAEDHTNGSNDNG